MLKWRDRGSARFTGPSYDSPNTLRMRWQVQAGGEVLKDFEFEMMLHRIRLIEGLAVKTKRMLRLIKVLMKSGRDVCEMR